MLTDEPVELTKLAKGLSARIYDISFDRLSNWVLAPLLLVLLFVKYVSDKYANNPDALIEVPVFGDSRICSRARATRTSSTRSTRSSSS